jgi:PAS domain S-box-containing protein
MLADLSAASVTVAERERLYRTLFDGGADAVLVLDGTRIREANRRADTLFGVAAGGLAGLELSGLALECQPDGQASSATLASRLLAADGSLFPWRARRPDGHLIDVEIALGRVAMSGSNVVLASLRDVTERNQLETQLRQVQKMETIGQLAGGVAHDFNNVLLAIMGSAELLARQAGQDARSRELAEGILNASQRAASLVRQLLAFSRKQGSGSTPLDLHVVLRETAELLSRTIVDQRIRVELRLESPLVTVIGDSAMLQNALLNLGVNARDAMPHGGCVTYATRLHAIDETAGSAHTPALPPGDYIEVAVIDTGTGMSEDVRRRCFEAFFTTKDPGKGTGLGLAAVAKTCLLYTSDAADDM